MKSQERRRGFILFVVMIGVLIFAMGVLALGRCLSTCVGVEGRARRGERARLALENRMAQVEAGEIPTDKSAH